MKSTFLLGNAVGLSVIAFASYFDIWSHRRLFIDTDPWWNPAHLMIYAGFLVLAYAAVRQKPRDGLVKLSLAGVVVILVSAVFNEIWHRVLLFGNPLPEPFPVEPPHALLAVGFTVAGVAALLYPFRCGDILSDTVERIAATFVSGSMWLIVAGSAFYVGGAYSSSASYLFAVGAGSFSASLFLVYPTALSKRFGYSTVSYLWFLLPYYAFFVSPSDGLPVGIALAVVIDALVAKGRVLGIDSRYPIMVVIAVFYGVVYYPILPPGTSLAVNLSLVLSAAGVAFEFAAERAYIRSRRFLPASISKTPGVGL